MYSIPALLRVDPALVDPDLSNVEAAQLFCFDGKATLSIIRSRGHVEIRHWNGGDNARDVNLRGVVFRLVGFRLHVEPRNVVQDDAQLLPPQLTAFVAMAALPTLQKAAEIRVYIERVSRAETHLCLRTDPLFFDYGGPRTDAFAEGLSEVSIQEFLRRPYIICSAGSQGRRKISTPTEPVVRAH